MLQRKTATDIGVVHLHVSNVGVRVEFVDELITHTHHQSILRYTWQSINDRIHSLNENIHFLFVIQTKLEDPQVSLGKQVHGM